MSYSRSLARNIARNQNLIKHQYISLIERALWEIDRGKKSDITIMLQGESLLIKKGEIYAPGEILNPEIPPKTDYTGKAKELMDYAKNADLKELLTIKAMLYN